MTWGTNHSSRDIGQTMQGNVTGATIFAAGIQFARRIDCTSDAAEALAQQIAAAYRKQTTGEGGGPSQFVQTCTPKFFEQQCKCIAPFVQATHPNVHQMTYSRDIIAQTINSSPFVALQMALACKVQNY